MAVPVRRVPKAVGVTETPFRWALLAMCAGVVRMSTDDAANLAPEWVVESSRRWTPWSVYPLDPPYVHLTEDTNPFKLPSEVCVAHLQTVASC